MPTITSRQCKAARQLLCWTQQTTATASGVSLSTVGSFENDENKDAKTKPPRADLIERIREAFEDAGIQFTDGQGVKLRCDDARTYKGENSCDEFFDEVLSKINGSNGSVLAFLKSPDMLTKLSGEPRRTNLDRLAHLHEITDVKCILADTDTLSFPMPSFEIRSVPRMAISPSSFFIYGNNIAFINLEPCLNFSILAIYTASMVQEHRKVFSIFWDNARPLQIHNQSSRTERRLEIVASV